MNRQLQPQALQTNTGNFAAALKYWRTNRRMSQLTLSLDANVSQRHISFLESGKSAPSRAMILQLAQSLQLSLREQNRLLQQAGFSPAFSNRSLDSDQMQSVRHALELQLRYHEPFPAVVMDKTWNLLMLNRPAGRLLSFLGDAAHVWQQVDPSGDKNMLKLTFSNQGFWPYLADGDALLAMMLFRLESELLQDPLNRNLQNLVDEIQQLAKSHGVADAPPEDEVTVPVVPLTLCLPAGEIRLVSLIAGFGSAIDVTAEELKVESFFPVDAKTEAFFQNFKMP